MTTRLDPGPTPVIGPIRPTVATPADLDAVLSVLDQAARRLAERGIVQWPASFHDDDGKRVVVLAERIERGEVILCRDRDGAGVPMGTISVSPDPDPDFVHGWPSDPTDALYVYRMARADAAVPRDFGRWLLYRAEVRAREAGKSWLRLDCSRTNGLLHQYYRGADFEMVGNVIVPGRKSGALFQRKVSTV